MLYKFPDGSIKSPQPFIYNDIQYGSEIFSYWTGQQLNEIGVYPFREEEIPFGYDGGIPVDVIIDTDCVRTYPNLIPQPERLKTYLENKIKTRRKNIEENGFIFDPTGLNVFIATDLKGSLRISQLQMMFASDPTSSVAWQGADPSDMSLDKWFIMTYQIWVQIVSAGMIFVQTCFNKQKELQETLNTLTTVDDMLTFMPTIDVGWPS